MAASQPAVGEHRRVDAAGQVAQLRAAPRRRRCAPRPAAAAPLGVGVQLLLGHAEGHAQRDQPRLRAVVQVALDPAQLGLLRVHGAGPARLERGDALGERLAVGERSSSATPACTAIAAGSITHTGQK